MVLKVDPKVESLLESILSQDKQRLAACLAEDVVFRPPTYWKDWRGRDLTATILSEVADVFQNFTYVRVFNDHPNYALEFKAKVGELDAEGVDLITLDDANLVSEFTVMMRPLKTVQVLREEMQSRLNLS